ncbi:MAG: SH3 domain-containing protein [Spirochaetaceae bacterium]|nr:SH3 domain-containing protein [Spirochaetaceae bacterium]
MRWMSTIVASVLIIVASTLLGSCTKLFGWGVLLWSAEKPPIPSGSLLPVYVRSNINQVWIAGIPKQYQTDAIDKIEISLPLLEVSSTKAAAQKRAQEFAEMALVYAETLQDGLPIREEPTNNAKRVYRLRMGEIIKILSQVEGTPTISTTGIPLDGLWYQVLTENGTIGYCFSYRLRFFEYKGGVLAISKPAEEKEDNDLEILLTKNWIPEVYQTMFNNQWINIDDLTKHWGFFPGLDTGIAYIYTADVNKTFAYTAIKPNGNRSWRFEGTSLQMTLRSDNLLAVQYSDSGFLLETVLFTELSADIDDLIMQERERRNAVYESIWASGPVFSSANYGLLSFLPEGRFSWTGYNLLSPRIVSSSSLGSGTVEMNLFLSRSLRSSFDGAFSFYFDGIGTTGSVMNMLYYLDDQGLHLEYVPPDNIDKASSVVQRRASSPLVIYFFRTEQQPVVPLQEEPMFFEEPAFDLDMDDPSDPFLPSE